jgi:predicted GIY-YIG superfamily endonuclease
MVVSMAYSIYEVTTVDDLRYVGMTKNLSKRMSDHKCKPHHGHPLKSYRILDTIENKEDAHDVEFYWINTLKPELNQQNVNMHPERKLPDTFIKSEYDRAMDETFEDIMDL